MDKKRDGVFRVGGYYEVWVDGEYYGAYIDEIRAREAYMRIKLKVKKK